MSKPVCISLDLKLTGQRIHNVMKECGYTVRQIQEICGKKEHKIVYRRRA